MSVKAVYASKTLAIYITGSDVDKLLQGNIVLGPVIAAKETIADEGIDIRMTVPGIRALRPLWEAEKKAYQRRTEMSYGEYMKWKGEQDIK